MVRLLNIYNFISILDHSLKLLLVSDLNFMNGYITEYFQLHINIRSLLELIVILNYSLVGPKHPLRFYANATS